MLESELKKALSIIGKRGGQKRAESYKKLTPEELSQMMSRVRLSGLEKKRSEAKSGKGVRSERIARPKVSAQAV